MLTPQTALYNEEVKNKYNKVVLAAQGTKTTILSITMNNFIALTSMEQMEVICKGFITKNTKISTN